jgi:hypothetical protein
MRTKTKLAWIRSVHTAIYGVLAASVVLIGLASLTRYRGQLLTLTLVLVAIESIVFVGNGRRCPLTALAKRYNAEKGWAFDMYLPERWTRYTFRFFGALLAFGIVMLVTRR